MELQANNGRKIVLTQANPDGDITVSTFSAVGTMGRQHEGTYAITPGNFVMLLNWYQYQKQNGNANLHF